MQLQINNIKKREYKQEWVLELTFPIEHKDLAAYYLSHEGEMVNVEMPDKLFVHEDDHEYFEPKSSFNTEPNTGTGYDEKVEDMKPKYISRLHGALGANKAAFKEKYGIESFSDLPEDLLKLCIDRIEFKDTPDDVRHVSEEQLKQSITEYYEKCN